MSVRGNHVRSHFVNKYHEHPCKCRQITRQNSSLNSLSDNLTSSVAFKKLIIFVKRNILIIFKIAKTLNLEDVLLFEPTSESYGMQETRSIKKRQLFMYQHAISLPLVISTFESPAIVVLNCKIRSKANMASMKQLIILKLL